MIEYLRLIGTDVSRFHTFNTTAVNKDLTFIKQHNFEAHRLLKSMKSQFLIHKFFFYRTEQLHIVETLLHILQMVSTVEKGVQGLGE